MISKEDRRGNYYGWYDFDPDKGILTNFKSGQTLTWISKTKKPYHIYSQFKPPLYDTHYDELTLEYKDNEISYPIIINRAAPIPVEGKNYHFILEIDHIESAILWSKANGQAKYPPYGLWQRVDDFIVDAVLCWPEKIINGNWPRVQVIGGWKQGKWYKEYRRNFTGRTDRIGQKQDYQIAEPYIEDLNAPIPQQWKYVDVEAPALSAELNGVVKTDHGIYYLPSVHPLAGFEKMPHLIRTDGKAVIFPARAEYNMHRGEDYCPYIWYTYADENVFFTFRSSPIYNLELSYCKPYGFRNLDILPHLMPTDVYGNPELDGGRYESYNLGYYMWRYMTIVIRDAWPQWRSKSAVCDYLWRNYLTWRILFLLSFFKIYNLPRTVKIRIISDGSDKGGVAVGGHGSEFSHGFEGGIANSWYATISYYQVIKYSARGRFYLAEFLERRRRKSGLERIKMDMERVRNKRSDL
jgi:hypothetical protein